MINHKQFTQICKRYFNFLENDYGFYVEDQRADTWVYEIIFKNNFVAVTLTFELRDFYLFVKLSKLRAGELPPKPGEIRPETLLESFDLDDIVTIRSKESLIPPYQLNTKFDEVLLEDIVKRQGANLKLFAADILEGDFSLFSELDKIVKNRAKQAAIQKWGDDAAKFGWSV